MLQEGSVVRLKANRTKMGVIKSGNHGAYVVDMAGSLQTHAEAELESLTASSAKESLTASRKLLRQAMPAFVGLLKNCPDCMKQFLKRFNDISI